MIEDTGEMSDGYHTFDELYEFRKVYHSLLFNEWGKQDLYDVHKSMRHNNHDLCFDGEYFIVQATLPTGQISNHYELKDWDMFSIPVWHHARQPWDGHSAEDVLKRLKGLPTI